ncbi:MAG: hypothetical protein EA394_04350 [Bacteroidia bacterium]|nr:MAG: hypothetical protein EA394_04350 [Bacteroidia bacterium]
MIVPMHKFSFLVFHRDYPEFLDKVRDIGVIHLIEKQEDVPDQVRDKYDLIKQVQWVVKQLVKRDIRETPGEPIADGKTAFDEVRELYSTLDEKYQQLTLLQKEISQVRPWGDFSKEVIQKLSGENLHVKFFTVAASRFLESWYDEYPIEEIGRHAGQVYFVLIQHGEEESEIDAEEMRPPERPLSELLHYRRKLEEDLDAINRELDKYASNALDAIKQYGYRLKEEVDYTNALANADKQADEKVMLLEGYVPDEKNEKLIAYLEKNNILYVTQKAEEKDKPPILLKNKKFAEKFEMLGDLYSLPKYSELDLTPFFAPFYMLFFGFCLGDAGYGILMSIAALLLKKKVRKELKQIMGLVFYLGVSTFFFGVISGVFFGIPLFDTGLPVYKELAARFEQQDTDINMLLFYLSLMLGGIQIIFGLFLKAINETKQFGWKHAVGTIGWILLITGSIALYAISRLTGIPFADISPAFYVLLAISGLMILFLNNLNRNIMINFGLGLWNTYNMATGILGDLLSYIRLFALGISSAILGFVFNSLAVSMSGNIPVVSILVMTIILVIGHGINLFMSGLGAFVHPMRLTFVEFYKNAGFSGGGKQYNPFKKIT